jgi:hypothetical protein
MAYNSRISNKYQQLSKELDQVRDDVVSGSDVDPLVKIIDQANSLVPTIEYSSEAYDDAQLIYHSADVTFKRVRNTVIGDNAEFDTIAYADKLAAFVTDLSMSSRDATILAEYGEYANLTKLGEMVYSKLNRPITVGFMVGPTDLMKKSRKVARQYGFDQESQTRPDGITAEDLQKDSRNETTKMVLEIYKSLKVYQDASEGQPIALFDFILNPQSFAQSVENMFYTSFLVRDGKVALEMDEDGIPVISIVDGEQEESIDEDDGPKVARNQVVIDLDYELWKGLCATLGRDEPLIDTRPDYNQEVWRPKE